MRSHPIDSRVHDCATIIDLFVGSYVVLSDRRPWRPLAPLDKNSAAVKRSAPGQQGGSASELALLQLGTCEEPQLVDMIEALLVAHPELAPEVRQMLVER